MADNNNILTDGIKKFFLAGVGAVATTAEKSQEIFDSLVQKGELTVEQGKALNQELRHTMEQNKESFKAKSASEEKTEAKAEEKTEDKAPEAAAEETKEEK